MPEPYPDDLRMRAVEKALAGESRRSWRGIGLGSLGGSRPVRRSRWRGCRIGLAGEASRRASPRFGAS